MLLLLWLWRVEKQFWPYDRGEVFRAVFYTSCAWFEDEGGVGEERFGVDFYLGSIQDLVGEVCEAAV